jgi:hypothetical protein
MQVLTAPPRQAFTDATIIRIIRDEPAVEFSAGLELLNMGLQVLDDLTNDFIGGSVARNAYATLHGTATLGLTRVLDWGRAIVRPYMNMTDGTTLIRFNLGAYFTSTPERTLGYEPETYGIAGYDMLHGLSTTVGEAYAVDAGVGYLDAVAAILTAQGYTRFVIDRDAAGTVLPSARVWPIDEQTKWLTIVNDLLGAIGYQGIWSDWDGWLRVHKYVSPSARSSEWTYDVDPETSMLDTLRTLRRDYFEAPNRWVAVRTNNIDGAAPVEGDGIYTYVNQYLGDTSVQARGRIISKVVPLEAADQASLVAAAQKTIDADTRTSATMALTTWPNPLHWHFDRVTLNDPDVGPVADVLSTSWTLPLDGSLMSHGWSLL